MTKKIVVSITVDKVSREDPHISWPEGRASDLFEMLKIIQQHSPKIYAKYFFKIQELDKLGTLRFLVKNWQNFDSTSKLRGKLQRPKAGRIPDDQLIILNVLDQTESFVAFNKLYKQQAGHAISERTYFRYKKKFNSYRRS